MKARLDTAKRAEFERHKIEKQGSVGLGRKADQFTFRLRGRRIVDVLQIRGLSAKPRTVVNDLAVYLP